MHIYVCKSVCGERERERERGKKYLQNGRIRIQLWFSIEVMIRPEKKCQNQSFRTMEID